MVSSPTLLATDVYVMLYVHIGRTSGMVWWENLSRVGMLYSFRLAFRGPTSHNEDKWYRPEFHWTVAPVHSSNIKACLRPFSWQRLAKFWCGCSLRDRFRADVHAECRNSGSSKFVALWYLIGYRLWPSPMAQWLGV